jgi:hypothetical protein
MRKIDKLNRVQPDAVLAWNALNIPPRIYEVTHKEYIPGELSLFSTDTTKQHDTIIIVQVKKQHDTLRETKERQVENTARVIELQRLLSKKEAQHQDALAAAEKKHKAELERKEAKLKAALIEAAKKDWWKLRALATWGLLLLCGVGGFLLRRVL